MASVPPLLDSYVHIMPQSSVHLLFTFLHTPLQKHAKHTKNWTLWCLLSVAKLDGKACGEGESNPLQTIKMVAINTRMVTL